MGETFKAGGHKKPTRAISSVCFGVKKCFAADFSTVSTGRAKLVAAIGRDYLGLTTCTLVCRQVSRAALKNVGNRVKTCQINGQTEFVTLKNNFGSSRGKSSHSPCLPVVHCVIENQIMRIFFESEHYP